MSIVEPVSISNISAPSVSSLTNQEGGESADNTASDGPQNKNQQQISPKEKETKFVIANEADILVSMHIKQSLSTPHRTPKTETSLGKRQLESLPSFECFTYVDRVFTPQGVDMIFAGKHNGKIIGWRVPSTIPGRRALSNLLAGPEENWKNKSLVTVDPHSAAPTSHAPKPTDVEVFMDHLVVGSHTGGVTCIAFYPRNKLLITGSSDYKLKIWDAFGSESPGSGRCVQCLPAHDATITCLAVHCNLIFTGSVDKTLKVWKFDDGREQLVYPWLGVKQVFIFDNWLTALWASDKKIAEASQGELYAADGNGNVTVFRSCVTSNDDADNVVVSHVDLLRHHPFNPFETGIVSQLGLSALANVGGGNAAHLKQGITKIMPIPNLNLLITLSYESSVKLSDLVAYKMLVRIQHPTDNNARFVDCAWSSTDEELILLDNKGHVFVWDSRSNKIRASRFAGYTAQAIVTWTKRGPSSFWVAHRERIDQLVITRRATFVEHQGHEGRILSLYLNPDYEASMKQVAAMTRATTVSATTSTKDILHSGKSFRKGLSDASPSFTENTENNNNPNTNKKKSSGSNLMKKNSNSSSSMKQKRNNSNNDLDDHFDKGDEERGQNKMAEADTILAAAKLDDQLSNQQYFLASASVDNTICLWTPSMTCIKTFKEKYSEITCFLALTNSLSWFVTGHDNGSLKFWSLGDERCFRFKAHENTVTQVCEGFHRCGKGGVFEPWQHIFSVSFDGFLTVWDMPFEATSNSRAKREARLQVSNSELLCCAYDAIKYCYIVGGNNGDVSMWSVDELKPIRNLQHVEKITRQVTTTTSSSSILAPRSPLQGSSSSQPSTKTAKVFAPEIGGGKLPTHSQMMSAYRNAHREAVTSLALDGNYCFSSGEDSSIHLWNTISGDLTKTLSFEEAPNEPGDFQQILVIPETGCLLACTRQGELFLFSQDTGSVTHTHSIGQEIGCMTYNRKTKNILVGLEDGVILRIHSSILQPVAETTSSPSQGNNIPVASFMPTGRQKKNFSLAQQKIDDAGVEEEDGIMNPGVGPPPFSDHQNTAGGEIVEEDEAEEYYD